MLGIYSFYWDCGRQGHIEGAFVADSKDIRMLMGREISFGDVLGKHSDVFGWIEEKDIALVSDNLAHVEVFQELFENGIGYNPLDYYAPQ